MSPKCGSPVRLRKLLCPQRGRWAACFTSLIGEAEKMPRPLQTTNLEKGSSILSIDLHVPNSQFNVVLQQMVRTKGRLNRDAAAHMVGMTAGGFSRSFISEFGWSFRETQREVKLQVAACLLSHTRMQISDIAEQVGYFELREFQKAFKRRFAVTASGYRAIEPRRNMRRNVDIRIILGETSARCKILLDAVLKPRSKSA
jgi:AraC-like DNA-binding protein